MRVLLRIITLLLLLRIITVGRKAGVSFSLLSLGRRL
jgi:hypothetical protein